MKLSDIDPEAQDLYVDSVEVEENPYCDNVIVVFVASFIKNKRFHYPRLVKPIPPFTSLICMERQLP